MSGAACRTPRRTGAGVEHWKSYFGPIDTGLVRTRGRWDKNIVREQIRIYHNAGLQVQVHCCGDREQDWILESYKLAQDANPIYGLRHGIIHADIPTDWALSVMPKWQKTLDYGYTYTNPDFMWWTEIIANSMGPYHEPQGDAAQDLPEDRQPLRFRLRLQRRPARSQVLHLVRHDEGHPDG